jgi:hypothetical protein
VQRMRREIAKSHAVNQRISDDVRTSLEESKRVANEALLRQLSINQKKKRKKGSSEEGGVESAKRKSKKARKENVEREDENEAEELDHVSQITDHSIADGGKKDPWFFVEWMRGKDDWHRGSTLLEEFPEDLTDYIMENCNEAPYNKFLQEADRKKINEEIETVALNGNGKEREEIVLPVDGQDLGKTVECDHGDYLDGGGYKREPNPYYCGPRGDICGGGCAGVGCNVMWVSQGKSIGKKTFRPSAEKPVFICRNRWDPTVRCKHAICGACWDAKQITSVRSRRSRS